MKLEQQRKKTTLFSQSNYQKTKPKIKLFETPIVDGVAMDSLFLTQSFKTLNNSYGVNLYNVEWFANRSFIGYQACVYIANHWLVNKACLVPAKDSLRHGYEIDFEDEDIKDSLEIFDKKIGILETLKNFIYMGKIFGGQLAFFDIKFSNPIQRKEFYENPFNIDGVPINSYKGIRLIDPIDVSPILTNKNVQDPTSNSYMRPEYYIIGSQKYHYSHFITYIPYEVPKLAKQRYNYFGVSLPERVYERVYCAEKTANETPQLAMTKRLVSVNMTGLEEKDQINLGNHLEVFAQLRDNYGVFVGDENTTITQLDTSLADLDTVIMTQYQLVSAISGVPATKLLEIQPKGFNSTGDYEAQNYRQDLESIQANDLEPVLKRHYELKLKSLGASGEVNIQWTPLDSPTAKEYAEIEKLKADTDAVYSNIGAIDGADIRARLKNDKESIYFNLEDKELEDESIMSDLDDLDFDNNPLELENESI